MATLNTTASFMEIISTIRNSIKYGYLSDSWHENKDELIKTTSGYFSLQSDCINLDNGDTWHMVQDSDNFAYDELNDTYICESDSVQAYGKKGRTITTHENETVKIEGEYYLQDYLSDNNIVMLHDGEYCNIDDAIYVDSEGEYYLQDECYEWSDGTWNIFEEPSQNNTLWDYSSGPKEKFLVHEDSTNEAIQFGFGMEIEKSKMPNFDFEKQELYDRTGAVIEKDGSVSNGFELKTPVYNLFSDKTFERLEELRNFCDVEGTENAGGHIGFSMENVTDEELLTLCSGWLPLIYSMYKKRLDNSYCAGANVEKLKSDRKKFQAICLRGNYIEFRIISAVKSFNSVLFRLQFFRLMAKNLGKSFGAVIGMATNNKSELYKLLNNDVYTNTDKFERLITDAIEINSQFGDKKLTQAKINQITVKLNKIRMAKINFINNENTKNN